MLTKEQKAIVEREFRAACAWAADASIEVSWRKGRIRVWADGESFHSVKLGEKFKFECDTASPVEFAAPFKV